MNKNNKKFESVKHTIKYRKTSNAKKIKGNFHFYEKHKKKLKNQKIEKWKIEKTNVTNSIFLRFLQFSSTQ